MVAANFHALISSMDSQIKLLEQLKFFDDNEIKAIKSYRKFYGSNLSKETSSSEDILLYLRYELDLLAVIREKKVEESLIKKKNMVTFSSANLLNKILSMVTGLFPEEFQLWCLYVKYCQEMRDTITLLNVIENLLKVHKDKPCAFQLASRCAREDFKNLSKARDYLMSGIRLHTESPELYKEAFLLELKLAREKFESTVKTEQQGDDKEAIQNKLKKSDSNLTKPIEYVYSAAVAKIHSVDFFIELFSYVKGVPFTKKLESRIQKDLQKLFPKEETMWDTLAKAKLEELNIPSIEPHHQKKILEEMIEIYKTAVEKLNSPTMWNMYVDRMWEIYDASVDMQKFKKNCMIYAFVAAYHKNQLKDKYYLIWAELQKDEERKLQLLKKGTGKLPTSVPLWSKLISNRLAASDEKEAWLLFREALVYFKQRDRTGSLPLWKLILRFYLCSRPDRVKWFFDQALSEASGVAKEMKASYLEWVVMSQGILAGREVYDKIASVQPYSMELHETMMKLENFQVQLNVKSMRKCYSLATEQFGPNDVSVWMKWIQFEYNVTKSRKYILKIRDRAMSLLQPAVVDEFNVEMRFLEINCLTSSKQRITARKLSSSLCKVQPGKKKVNSAIPKSGGNKRKRLST